MEILPLSLEKLSPYAGLYAPPLNLFIGDSPYHLLAEYSVEC